MKTRKEFCDIFFFFFIILLSSRTCDAKISDTLKVKLSHGGGIIGRYLSSFRGHGIRAFMGIPYAEPPVGDLRFQNPIPKIPWSGYMETLRNEVICPQPIFTEGLKVDGKEDCLYLNVYVPQFPNTTDPLPVMVYFHGGGWTIDSAAIYSPDFFLDHDIILVVGNYRLGALGFLTTNTSDSPGNFGLKDKVLMLKWIQENIAAFRGDKDQVTIFGESAGSASVTYLMAYSSGKGLFHKAIAQSGNFLNPWAFLETSLALERTKKFGEALGCQLIGNKWNELVECLRGKSANDLVKYSETLNVWDSDPPVKFPPVVEHDTINGFITEYSEHMKDNHGLKIPLLIGLTRDEGVVRSAGIKSRPRVVDDLAKRWDDVLPIILSYDYLADKQKSEITNAVNNFYFNGLKGKAAIEMTHNFTNMCTDFMFFKGFNKYLEQRLKCPVKTAETFVYNFAHSGDGTYKDFLFGPSDEEYGVCHADDLLYLFPLLQKPIFKSAPNKEDIFMQETLVKLWVNFAISGKPTPVENVDVDWIPAEKFPLDYLRIGNYKNPNAPVFAMEKDYWSDRSSFLRNLF